MFVKGYNSRDGFRQLILIWAKKIGYEVDL